MVIGCNHPPMIDTDSSNSSLALGTVQFGLDYGITNQAGKPSLHEVKKILATAARGGIDLLDTASGYGDSEAVLGSASDQSEAFSVVTKTPNWGGVPSEDCTKDLAESFEASLRQLEREDLWGLMVHLASDLTSDHGPRIWRGMQSIKASGKVMNIGISFYADDPIDDLIATFRPDFVQLPLNVLDQRLIANGELKRLHEAGIEIHARSVFLQGLLMSRSDDLPNHLHGLKPSLGKFTAICGKAGISQLEGALAFARSVSELSRIVVGVTTSGELEAICRAFNTASVTSLDWKAASCDDPNLVDPRFWPKP
ncbi:MAG TPA: hypothetical protein EYQ81_16060 [Sneathiellales bacterium]|nr:hypothetical protein [Sneathiellales bacterium]